MDYDYCDMCGNRKPIGCMNWVSTDEYGPVYRCVACMSEDMNTEDTPSDEGYSDADSGL